jgi:1-acyl-sn-glycerol-3-phosphate acyltransferase
MINTFEFMPPGQTRPNFGVRPGVRYGEPLDFSRYYGMETDRHALREVTDEIMRVIEKLSGQESVDMYAQTAKRKLAAGEPIENDPAQDDLAKDETLTDGEL